MNLKSLPFKEKGSLGYFWEEGTFAIQSGIQRGRWEDMRGIGADKRPMPAYANQDYPCRGIIDSFWPGPDFLGIELVARGSFLVSNAIFEFWWWKMRMVEIEKKIEK